MMNMNWLNPDSFRLFPPSFGLCANPLFFGAPANPAIQPFPMPNQDIFKKSALPPPNYLSAFSNPAAFLYELSKQSTPTDLTLPQLTNPNPSLLLPTPAKNASDLDMKPFDSAISSSGKARSGLAASATSVTVTATSLNSNGHAYLPLTAFTPTPIPTPTSTSTSLATHAPKRVAQTNGTIGLGVGRGRIQSQSKNDPDYKPRIKIEKALNHSGDTWTLEQGHQDPLSEHARSSLSSEATLVANSMDLEADTDSALGSQHFKQANPSTIAADEGMGVGGGVGARARRKEGLRERVPLRTGFADSLPMSGSGSDWRGARAASNESKEDEEILKEALGVKTLRGKFRIAPVIENGRAKFKCTLCSASFTTSSEFTVHIRAHNAPPPTASTPAAGAQAVSESGLDQDEDQKPNGSAQTPASSSPAASAAPLGSGGFSCVFCSKTLSSQSSLDRHMLVHSGERPFKCTLCPMSFTTNGNMHRHMKVHQKELDLDIDQLIYSEKKRHRRTRTGSASNSSSAATRSNPKRGAQASGTGAGKQGQSSSFPSQIGLVSGHGGRGSSKSQSESEDEADELSIDDASDAINDHSEYMLPMSMSSHDSITQEHIALAREGQSLASGNKVANASTNPARAVSFPLHLSTPTSMEGRDNRSDTNSPRTSNDTHSGAIQTTLFMKSNGKRPRIETPEDLVGPDQSEEGTAFLPKRGRRTSKIEQSSFLPHINEAMIQVAFPQDPKRRQPISRLTIKQNTNLPSVQAASQLAPSPKMPGSPLPPSRSLPAKSPVKTTCMPDFSEQAQVEVESDVQAQNATESKEALALSPNSASSTQNPLAAASTLALLSIISSLSKPNTPQSTGSSGIDDMARVLASAIGILTSGSGPVSQSSAAPTLDSKPMSNGLAPMPNADAKLLGIPALDRAELDNPIEEKKIGTLVPGMPRKNEGRSQNGKQAAHKKKAPLEIKWHVCKFCSQKFDTLNGLRVHVRDHQGLRPYKCNACPYTSVDKSTLVRHMRTHNGERPYQCKQCGFAFTTKANCERHIRTRHHKGSDDKEALSNCVRYTGSLADNKAAFESGLFGSPDTRCHTCGQDFKYFRALRQHVRTHETHSVDQAPMSSSKSGPDSNLPGANLQTEDLGEMKEELSPNNLSEYNGSGASDIDSSTCLSSPNPSVYSAQVPLAPNDEWDGVEKSSQNAVINQTSALPLEILSQIFNGQKPEALSVHTSPPLVEEGPLDLSIKRSMPSSSSDINSVESRTQDSKVNTNLQAPTVPTPAKSPQLSPPAQNNDSNSGVNALLRLIQSVAAAAAQVSALSGIAPSNKDSETSSAGQNGENSRLVSPPSVQVLSPPPSAHASSSGTSMELSSNSGSDLSSFSPLDLTSRTNSPSSISTPDSKRVNKVESQNQNRISQMQTSLELPIAHKKLNLASPNSLGSSNVSFIAPKAAISESAGALTQERMPAHAHTSLGHNSTKALSPGQTQPMSLKVSTPASSFTPLNSFTSPTSTLAKMAGAQESTPKPAARKRNSYADSPKRVRCPVCSRAFPWLSSLNRHLVTHTGQKPFACPTCSLEFSTKSNRERHLHRKHHPPGTRSRKRSRPNGLAFTFESQSHLESPFSVEDYEGHEVEFSDEPQVDQDMAEEGSYSESEDMGDQQEMRDYAQDEADFDDEHVECNHYQQDDISDSEPGDEDLDAQGPLQIVDASSPAFAGR